jgi:hypothetical protein
MDIRTAVARTIRSETNRWMWDFAHTISVVPAAVVDGRLTEAILDEYPLDTTYPEQLSRAIAHQVGEIFHDETDDPTVITVGGEDTGEAIKALHALRVGDVGTIETEGDGSHTWSFYQDNIEAHGITIDQFREYVTGMSWTEAAQLVVDAHTIPITDAEPGVVVGTGGFVTRWLRPGDFAGARGKLDDGEHGIGIVGSVNDLVGTAEQLAEFGQRIAARWQSPLVMALSDLGDVLATERGMTQFPQSLTCGEADALARVLALSGSFDAAVGLLGTHAEADDGEETHNHIRELARIDEERTPRGQKIEYSGADAAATEYVRLLIAD